MAAGKEVASTVNIDRRSAMSFDIVNLFDEDNEVKSVIQYFRSCRDRKTMRAEFYVIEVFESG